ncbi:MAG: YdiU family protein [Desulfobacterales bacterium]|nr:YdiU family protein [Desulfobacterales bacterium]
MISFDNTYSRLPELFYARVAPAKAPKPELIKWNIELARQLGAPLESLTDNELGEIFTGQKLLPGSEPIALAYAGHQFGHFVPQLGDGRALLLGEVLDPSGRRYDIQLKGSGRTPFSRLGDGKAPLGPVLREYLVSEALHTLGLPTTRALAAAKTGELVYRDKAFPGAMLTRVASSHLRIGTFEYFAARQDMENLEILTQYAIKRHYPEIQNDSEAYLQFFRKVGHAQVELVTSWMAVGFIHGVMNTDNMSIAGEAIDFGPCAFMDQFRFNQVFSSIDQFGRYSYANQAQITLWNLSRLANCLILLSNHGSKEEIEMYKKELDFFGNLFDQRLTFKMRKKLGIFDDEQPQDRDLIRKWLLYLEAQQLDYTLSFRNLANLLTNDADSDFFEQTGEFQDFQPLWRKRIQLQDLEPRHIREQMNRVNPVFIPRNHKIEQVIESALTGDFSLFHEMNKVLKKPYAEQKRFNSYKSAPGPEQVVHATFCGT